MDIPPVGENLKRERMARQLSLGELGKLSGISKAMLSQIESGRVNPTLVTLWKAANALGVDLNALISGKKEEPEYFCRLTSEQQACIVSPDGKTIFKILSAPGFPDHLEMYHVTLEPGALHRSEPHGAGCREFVLVLSGKVTVTSGGSAAELGAGDFLAYRGDQLHTLENRGPERAELHLTDLNS